MRNRNGCTHFEAALTIATMPARTASGNSGQGGQDDGQVRVFGWQDGSAFGSAHGTRTDVCCRTLAEIGLALMRRNSVAMRIGGTKNPTRLVRDRGELDLDFAAHRCHRNQGRNSSRSDRMAVELSWAVVWGGAKPRCGGAFSLAVPSRLIPSEIAIQTAYRLPNLCHPHLKPALDG